MIDRAIWDLDSSSFLEFPENYKKEFCLDAMTRIAQLIDEHRRDQSVKKLDSPLDFMGNYYVHES